MHKMIKHHHILLFMIIYALSGCVTRDKEGERACTSKKYDAELPHFSDDELGSLLIGTWDFERSNNDSCGQWGLISFGEKGSADMQIDCQIQGGAVWEAHESLVWTVENGNLFLAGNASSLDKFPMPIFSISFRYKEVNTSKIISEEVVFSICSDGHERSYRKRGVANSPPKH